MKYQCNLCGKIFDRERDANDCHPDIVVLSDEKARLAEQFHTSLAAELKAAAAKFYSNPERTA